MKEITPNNEEEKDKHKKNSEFNFLEILKYSASLIAHYLTVVYVICLSEELSSFWLRLLLIGFSITIFTRVIIIYYFITYFHTIFKKINYK